MRRKRRKPFRWLRGKRKAAGSAASRKRKGKKIKRRKQTAKKTPLADAGNGLGGRLPEWVIRDSKRSPSSAWKKPVLITIALVVILTLAFLWHPWKTTVRTRPQKTAVRIHDVTPKLISEKKEVPVKPQVRPEATDKKKKKIVAAPARPEPAAPVSVRKRTPVDTRKGPYIVLIIDDVGNTRNYESLFTQLGDDVTYAILPLLKYSGYFSALGRKTNAEVFLHLPIESTSGPEKDPGKISPVMSRGEIIRQLDEDLNSVPECVGVNNHKGSLGTTDVRLMRIVLSHIKEKGLFFLDSYTTANSVAASIAKELGLPSLKRDIFLDNTDSPDTINAQLTQLARVAKQKGYAIGIGHYRYNTIKTLTERIPELKQQGYIFIKLSELIKKKDL